MAVDIADRPAQRQGQVDPFQRSTAKTFSSEAPETGSSTFGSLRPEYLAQQRLQETANEAPRVRRLTQLQAMFDRDSDGSTQERRDHETAVVQRVYTTGLASGEDIGAIAADVHGKRDVISGAGSWARAAFQGLMESVSARFPHLPPVTLMPNAELQAEKEELGDQSPDASFDEKAWQMYIDPKYLELAFSDASWGTLTEFIAHEIRHADQYFRAALAAAQAGQDAQAIVQELEVPQAVAQAAVDLQGNQATAIGGVELAEAQDIRGRIPALEQATEASQNAGMYEGLRALAVEALTALHAERQALPADYTYNKNLLGEVTLWRQALRASAAASVALARQNLEAYKVLPPGAQRDHAEAAMDAAIASADRDLGILQLLKALRKGTITPQEWARLLEIKFNEHTQDVQLYTDQMEAAIATYANDPLEVDARAAGAALKLTLAQLRQAAQQAEQQAVQVIAPQGNALQQLAAAYGDAEDDDDG